MRTDKELLQAALAAIECSERPNSALIEEIADRLAEPGDEPVCWFDENYSGIEEAFSWIPEGDHTIPLYRHPRQPVRLSDEEIREVMLSNGFEIKPGHADLKPYVYQAVRAIENAIWEKNR